MYRISSQTQTQDHVVIEIVDKWDVACAKSYFYHSKTSLDCN